MRAHRLAFAIASAALLLIANDAFAAPCVTPAATAQQIADFRANPRGLLNAASSDMQAIETAVRDLVGTEPALANDVIALAQLSTPQQQTAIAAGLAQAAIACQGTDPQSAQAIQVAVASMPDGQFQAAFAAVVGDVATAAVAAASAASSVGSTVIVNPNSGGGASPEFPGRVNSPRSNNILAVSGPSVTTRGGDVFFAVVSPTN